ncbi:DUF4832 domain-containing protein [Paenibacillus pinistramenti]|uniref:DUF4832 domain-containing protein n=1 Tax=Paenibacillus pinistramenti TaxID=1768003 RepID=UPI001108ADB4|nr:DUF4832 domain-containing protein [Paenibacillus pinistramenti]
MNKKPQILAAKLLKISLLLLLCASAVSAASPQPALSVNFPVETGDVLYNPYIGFAADAREPEEVKQKVTLVHANLTWKDLEPEEGVYDFSAIEENFNFEYWKSYGARIILRVVLDYPGEESHMDIPDWLYEKIGEKGTWYDNDYGKGFSPDYTSTTLIAEHKKLIAALADRYNNDPFVAFIQLGSVGHWGEWHTMDSEPGYIPFPKRQVTDQYVAPYVQYFTNKQLLMRRPMQAAAKYGMGLFNDAFGKHDSTIDGFLNWYTNGYTSWLTQEQEPAMPDFWKTAPSGGEFSGWEQFMQNSALTETLAQAKSTHVSWLGPDAPWNAEQGGALQANIDKFLKTIGYRFVIQKAVYEKERKPGETLHVRMITVNRGVAPFYFKWPLELSLADAQGNVKASVRSSTDIRKWLPGSSTTTVYLTVPKGLPAGTYTVQAAILDPDTGQPGVNLAIQGRGEDGRYKLGSLVVR